MLRFKCGSSRVSVTRRANSQIRDLTRSELRLSRLSSSVLGRILYGFLIRIPSQAHVQSFYNLFTVRLGLGIGNLQFYDLFARTAEGRIRMSTGSNRAGGSTRVVLENHAYDAAWNLIESATVPG